MFPINIINFTIILTYLEGVKVYKKPISFIYIFLGFLTRNWDLISFIIQRILKRSQFLTLDYNNNVTKNFVTLEEHLEN